MGNIEVLLVAVLAAVFVGFVAVLWFLWTLWFELRKLQIKQRLSTTEAGTVVVKVEADTEHAMTAIRDATVAAEALGTAMDRVRQGPVVTLEAVAEPVRLAPGMVESLDALACCWNDWVDSAKGPQDLVVSDATFKAVHGVLDRAGWIDGKLGKAVMPNG